LQITDLHGEELFAAARERASDGNFEPYTDRLEQGDVRAALFVLFVGGRLGGLPLEDQLANEPGEIDDWLAIQVHRPRDRYMFTICATRAQALQVMAEHPEDGGPQAVMDLRSGASWSVSFQARVGEAEPAWAG